MQLYRHPNKCKRTISANQNAKVFSPNRNSSHISRAANSLRELRVDLRTLRFQQTPPGDLERPSPHPRLWVNPVPSDHLVKMQH